MPDGVPRATERPEPVGRSVPDRKVRVGESDGVGAALTVDDALAVLDPLSLPVGQAETVVEPVGVFEPVGEGVGVEVGTGVGVEVGTRVGEGVGAGEGDRVGAGVGLNAKH